MSDAPNWGILRVAGHAGFVEGMVTKYLPEGHRIVASRDADDHMLYREYIIQGPDMPVVVAGQNPDVVDLLFMVDDSGTWCYWGHKDHKRWPVHQSA
jgi:hypothetical protein